MFNPSKLELTLDGNETADSLDDHRLALNEKTANELNKKLVSSIIEQINEQDRTYEQLPTLLKTMLRNLFVSSLTV